MKKLFALFVGLVCMMTVLVACGSSTTDKESKSETAETEVRESSVDEVVSEAVAETSCDVDVSEDRVSELISIENVEIPTGSTAADFMKAIEHDADKVNYVSYDLNDVDLDTPGEYTVGVSINVPKDEAEGYVDKGEIEEDADTVNLVTQFNITVTGEPVVSEAEEQTNETVEETVEDENSPVENTGETETAEAEG